MSDDPTRRPNLRPASNALFVMACVVVVLFGMRAASEVIIPLLVAFILAMIFLPLQRFLMARRIPFWLALVIVLLIILIVLSATISVTVVSITRFVGRFPEYTAEMEGWIDNLWAYVEQLPIDTTNFLNTDSLDITRVLNAAGGILGSAADAFGNWFIVILLVAFMLADMVWLPQKLHEMFPDGERVRAISGLMSSIRRYLTLTTQVGLATGVANTVVLTIMGVDFAVLWGILGFVLNFIPNVGIALSMIPPAILALLEFGWQRALVVIVLFWLINMILENIIKPQVASDQLDMSPLAVMVSLVIWGSVLGPLGSILAVPLTLITSKLLLETSEETQWLAVLLSANPKPSRPDRRLARRLARRARKQNT